MAQNWSDYQNNIYAFCENERGNAIVRAVAGSGKTTTGVEAFNRMRPQGNGIFLAFNKAIADELKARGVNARTFHSVTYGPVMQARGVREVDNRKDYRVFRATAKSNQFGYYKFVGKLVALAKNAGVGVPDMMADTEDNWLGIVAHHGLELEEDTQDLGTAIELARNVLDAHCSDHMVNFDDMLYMAVRENMSLQKFDYIFLDEAQDTNAIQRVLLRKMMHKDTRLIAVGDPAQSIYGFRGADSNSMELLRTEFACTDLPLTVSYRCPASVVKYAQQWVPEIEAAPGAKDGTVENLRLEWDLQTFKPGDLIVCRTTRQIVDLGFKFIREQIPATIMGKEIGDGLKALIRKMETSDLDVLVSRIEAWRDREAYKATKEGDEAKAETIYDKADAITNIVEGMPEGMRTVEQVYAVLDYLFSPNRNAIVLATIHKSKGLEANRVFWLGRSQCPAKWARKPWQVQQELNLCYVAATRAKAELYFLDERTTFNKAPEDVLIGKTASISTEGTPEEVAARILRAV